MLPIAILALLPVTTLAKHITPGFYSLNFDVSRGSTYETSKVGANARLRRRATEDGYVLTDLDNESTFYSAELKIGSTEQTVIALVDTGSSDLWVTSSDNPYCESSSSGSGSKYRVLDDLAYHNSLLGSKDVQGKATYSGVTDDVSSIEASLNCSQYGTFDSSESTSWNSNDTEFYIVYGDSTFAYGTWGYDNVWVGDMKVENLSFAVANQTNSTVSVLGIGLEGLETTYSGSTAATSGSRYTYANLPAKMVQDGLIHKRAYSLYLNSYDATTGNVLFGAVDHAKYDGTLSTVGVINTSSSSGYSSAIKLEVTLSNISYDGEGQLSSSIAALLDSGTTLTYLPSDVISAIASQVGAQYSSSEGYYLMSCPESSANQNITFNFDGVSIPAPLDNFILSADSAGITCVLALMDIGSTDYAILGDSFLRSAYLVYDLDDLEIGMAPVVFTDEEDIEVITSTIPSASAASGSSTASISDDSNETASLLGDSSLVSTITLTSGSSTKSPSTASASASASSSSSGSRSSSGGSTIELSSLAILFSLSFAMLTVL